MTALMFFVKAALLAVATAIIATGAYMLNTASGKLVPIPSVSVLDHLNLGAGWLPAGALTSVVGLVMLYLVCRWKITTPDGYAFGDEP